MGSLGFIVSVTLELQFLPLIVRVHAWEAPSESVSHSGNMPSSLEARVLVPLLGLASK